MSTRLRLTYDDREQHCGLAAIGESWKRLAAFDYLWVRGDGQNSLVVGHGIERKTLPDAIRSIHAIRKQTGLPAKSLQLLKMNHSGVGTKMVILEGITQSELDEFTNVYEERKARNKVLKEQHLPADKSASTPIEVTIRKRVYSYYHKEINLIIGYVKTMVGHGFTVHCCLTVDATVQFLIDYQRHLEDNVVGNLRPEDSASHTKILRKTVNGWNAFASCAWKMS